MFKKLAAILMVLVLTLSMVACEAHDKGDTTNPAGEAKSITIAYQQGIGYALIHIMEAKGLIQKYYTGNLDVNFQLLASGAAINEGVIGGNIDIGCMGAAPAISGVVAGIPYKCIANLTSQPNGLMTNKESIKSLSDITPEDKIALINTGSIQHIYLAMACEKYLGDAHALDNNIQPMQHAEGMAALESGTVALHLTSSPFIGQERANENYHELTEVIDVCPVGQTFLVAMAATKLEEDKELFEAIQKAFKEASDIMANNKDEVADIEVNYLNMDRETIMGYLTASDSSFGAELKGVGNVVEFMYRAGFITSELKFDDFKFSSVAGN